MHLRMRLWCVWSCGVLALLPVSVVVNAALDVAALTIPERAVTLADRVLVRGRAEAVVGARPPSPVLAPILHRRPQIHHACAGSGWRVCGARRLQLLVQGGGGGRHRLERLPVEVGRAPALRAALRLELVVAAHAGARGAGGRREHTRHLQSAAQQQTAQLQREGGRGAAERCCGVTNHIPRQQRLLVAVQEGDAQQPNLLRLTPGRERRLVRGTADAALRSLEAVPVVVFRHR